MALEYPKVKKIIKPSLKSYLDIYFSCVKTVKVPIKTKSLATGSTKDPKDDMFLALSEYSKADYLVSLDRKHLVVLRKWKNTKIVLPPLAILGVAKSYGFSWDQKQNLANWWDEIQPKLIKFEG